MARFDQLEFKLDARDRRVDRLKATRLPKPDQPYFSDDGDVDGYRSQGDVWPTDEDGPPVFNHGRRVRCGDVRRRRGTGRDLNRREAGLAQPGSGTIPYRAHTASWPRTSWDRPAARVTTEFDRGFRGYRQPTSWDPPINRPSCWDPPGNRPIPSFQPYDPPRSWQPSCWEPPPHRASQGYSDYDQPPPCLPSCGDTPRRQTDHFRLQRSPRRPSTQPWHPNRPVFDSPSHQSSLFLVSCEEKQLGVEGDSDVLNQVDLQLNGMKLVDEEVCYETVGIPSSHSSSLDHEGAHPTMKPTDSLNWRGSFLESKPSILDDNRDKAIYNDDELIEMEHQSSKGRDGRLEDQQVSSFCGNLPTAQP